MHGDDLYICDLKDEGQYTIYDGENLFINQIYNFAKVYWGEKLDCDICLDAVECYTDDWINDEKTCLKIKENYKNYYQYHLEKMIHSGNFEKYVIDNFKDL
jgi:hypothetical protein